MKCRSAYHRPELKAASTSVKPGATTVMVEFGVTNFHEFSSNSIDEFKPEDFDVIISCCSCRSKLTSKYANWRKYAVSVNWNLDYPPNTDPGNLSEYKRVRYYIQQKDKRSKYWFRYWMTK
eukprot:Mrub_08019.p1 GENE.Mrub_08019~~Mrub_08019.p1  ORF type:complete len:121 (-),score=6.16 Mrub_08019:58-420(-)